MASADSGSHTQAPRATHDLFVAGQIFDAMHTLTHSLESRQRRGEESIAPHHMRALRVIGRGPIRPGALAHELAISPRAATDVVSGLLARGLVTQDADQADRRAQLVTITAKGYTAVITAHQKRASIAAQTLSGLQPEQQEELLALLELAVGSIEASTPASFEGESAAESSGRHLGEAPLN